jgi:phosphoribosylanthranilate isomerase
MTAIKICGLSDEAGHAAARDAGAEYVGFVFFPPSPRAVTPDQAGAIGAPGGKLRVGPLRVGLFVDPDDALLASAIPAARLDLVQLHGHETPARVAEVRQKFGLKVIKVLPVATAEDVAAAAGYAAADFLMFDAKPPPGAALTGGNAQTFDWTVLRGVRIGKPWFLAGGLHAGNVAEAIRIARPTVADVSSGVEATRGVKDPARIRAFIAAVRAADAAG